MLVSANIFQPLIDVFESVLTFFHNSVGVSWGWSIVLLTVAVRAVLIPLTVKQFGSMQRLQQLQPQLKEIQSKYKDDKERQQQEMMRFYRENKVNPLGSCLPMVLQIPVFISLFYMLRKNLRVDICPAIQHTFQAHYAALHHIPLAAAAGVTRPCGPNGGASFWFIPDLTNNAHGVVLIVLIVLYVGTQLASSLMMSSATMDQTQRRIMLFMPLIFVLFVINFPAGVLVYWITTNTWTMAQQWVIRRRIGPTRPAVATAGAPAGAAAAVSARSQAETPPGTGTGNGAAPSIGGLGARLRARGKPAEPEPVAAPARSGPPPKPPRKKKKRSGRRR